MTTEINRREIYRYLGYRGHEADEKTKELVENCVEELGSAAEWRYRRREVPLHMTEDGEIDCGFFRTTSKDLSRNLSGCGQVLLMGATLGIGVDRLLVKYGKLNVTRAVVLQAAAAAMIEGCCNELVQGWKQEYEAKGLYLRPRFSPGYGDFSLECQAGILQGLDMKLTLTDGGLMVPTKSVTAVIGISGIPQDCRVEGCEICEKTDCMYRRTSNGHQGPEKHEAANINGTAER